MTGYDIFKKSSAILGYYRIEEGHSPIRGEAFTDMINQILLDLKLECVEDLSDEINLTPKQTETLTYGSSMLLAIALKDESCARLYSELYNAKRGAVLGNNSKRCDVLPATSDGGV